MGADKSQQVKKKKNWESIMASSGKKSEGGVAHHAS